MLKKYIQQVPKEKQRVLILGSGWAGHSLVRNLDTRYYQPVLVSPRTHFVFTPLLASCAVGTLEFRTVLEPVRWNSTSLFKRIFGSKEQRSGEGVRPIFFQGWADQVDLKRKVVSVETAIEDDGNAQGAEVKGSGQTFEVPFDKLIIAVGCYSQTFGIEGVAENAFFLKDVGQARKIRKRILECFEQAALPTSSEQRKQRLLHFAIVGGGPTGIEFAAELHDLLKDDMTRIYPELSRYIKITIFDVAPKILNMFDANLQIYAEKHFARQGITIRTGMRVKSVNPKGLILKNDKEGTEQEIVPAGMTVWSTGLANTPFITNLATKLTTEASIPHQDSHKTENFVIKKAPGAGRLVTDSHFRVKLQSNGPAGETTHEMTTPDMFALGDCAAIEGNLLPATAQVANQEAIHLAKILNAAARKGNGKLEEEKPFKFKNLGMMAYLGSWRAILAGNHGANLKGTSAWIIWRCAYLTKSISWRNKILVAVYWFMSSVFGRDVSRF